MIKRGAGRVLLGVDEDEFRGLCSLLAIPEAVFLGDPARRHIGDIDAMTQIAREKLLGALIVLACALSRGSANRYAQKDQQENPAPPQNLHKDFPS